MSDRTPDRRSAYVYIYIYICQIECPWVGITRRKYYNFPHGTTHCKLCVSLILNLLMVKSSFLYKLSVELLSSLKVWNATTRKAHTENAAKLSQQVGLMLRVVRNPRNAMESRSIAQAFLKQTRHGSVLKMPGKQLPQQSFP